ncbi:nucleoside 2-deoxyribosyltransferase [Candidatus Parcubacteria bacterium]|nr:nucleoside 2-deoxyribosyltransferase [Candidatus Parcubacteria bacterium]
MKIYIAAPLFNDIEKKRNVEIRDYLQGLGFETYLPQEDGSVAFDRIKSGEERSKVRTVVFENDIKAIKECDAMLCVLDGRVPDEGMCIELGMAYILGKKCIGYKTDQRSFDKFGDNLMIEGCLETIIHSKEDLKAAFSR